MINKKHFGFTLAEIIVVLTLIGTVAAITIPSALNNTSQKSNKVKIKKAMKVYDDLMNNIIIANSLKNDEDIDSWAGTDCTNMRDYFKKIKEDGSNTCIFRTADGLWWNVSNPRHVMVSLKEEKLEDKYANDKTDYEAFYLDSEFRTDIGALMIDDYGYTKTTKSSQYKKTVRKLACYLDNICVTGLEDYNTSCTQNRWYHIKEKKNNNDVVTYYCNDTCSECGGFSSFEYDSNGKLLRKYVNCATHNVRTKDSDGSTISHSAKKYCDSIYIYNDDGKTVAQRLELLTITGNFHLEDIQKWEEYKKANGIDYNIYIPDVMYDFGGYPIENDNINSK